MERFNLILMSGGGHAAEHENHAHAEGGGEGSAVLETGINLVKNPALNVVEGVKIGVGKAVERVYEGVFSKDKGILTPTIGLIANTASRPFLAVKTLIEKDGKYLNPGKAWVELAQLPTGALQAVIDFTRRGVATVLDTADRIHAGIASIIEAPGAQAVGYAPTSSIGGTGPVELPTTQTVRSSLGEAGGGGGGHGGH